MQHSDSKWGSLSNTGSDLGKPITLSCHNDPNKPSACCWKVWSLKYAWCTGAVSYVFEQLAGCCHQHCKENNQASLLKNGSTSCGHVFRKCELLCKHLRFTYEIRNTLTLLTVNVASHLSAHTICKACVISAHFSRIVWKEIANLLPSPAFLFFFSCAFVLDDQAVGWSVWPLWPFCFNWRKFANG